MRLRIRRQLAAAVVLVVLAVVSTLAHAEKVNVTSLLVEYRPEGVLLTHLE